jgi:hypothetical protein
MSYWSGYGVAPIEVRLRSLAQGYVRQASWQRIGGESPPWESFGQPPNPDARRPVEADVKRSKGKPRAKY